jgi:hypothetical protein
VIIVILGVALASFLNPELRAKSKVLLLASFPLVVLLYFSFTINARINPQFNSVATRVDQIGSAIHVWHLSPILGEGMRFYNLPQFISVTAPPNVFIDNLASTGIVGSLAFVFLVCVTVRTLYRLPYLFGTLGLVILLFHYVDGLFDIFWIGASSIAPFILAGVSLGIADLDKSGRGATEPALDLAVRSGRPARAVPSVGPRTGRGALRSMVATVARSRRAMVQLLAAL